MRMNCVLVLFCFLFFFDWDWESIISIIYNYQLISIAMLRLIYRFLWLSHQRGDRCPARAAELWLWVLLGVQSCQGAKGWWVLDRRRIQEAAHDGVTRQWCCCSNRDVQVHDVAAGQRIQAKLVLWRASSKIKSSVNLWSTDLVLFRCTTPIGLTKFVEWLESWTNFSKT